LTRPTSVALGFSAAAALSLSIVNPTSVASAAIAKPQATPPPATGVTAVTGLEHVLPVALADFERSDRQKRSRHRPRVRTYTVRKGDSLWSIAAQEHVNWYNLVADNHLQLDSAVYPGIVLTLPEPGQHVNTSVLVSSPVTATASTSGSSPATSTESQVAPTTTTVTPSNGMSSFEQCVISRESGGNPQVTNGSGHYGLFQFSESTWVAYGGNPAEFGDASAAEQEQVFDNAMARGGESNWAPYDGC
jgi:hypothetical protein